MKLKNAAQITAYCGRRTRVDTMGAIEFAASCSPLRKSNSSATPIRMVRTGRPSAISTALHLFDHDRADLVGDVIEAVGDLFQVVVDLGADNKVHGVGAAMLEEQLLEPDIVEIIDAAFELGQLFGDRIQLSHILADRLQQRQRAYDKVRAVHQQRSNLAHRRLEDTDLEQDDGLGGLLHLIDGVVHRCDQVLDIAAVERGDEGA